MLQYFAALSVTLFALFTAGCSEFTEIFIEEVNIIATDDLHEDALTDGAEDIIIVIDDDSIVFDDATVIDILSEVHGLTFDEEHPGDTGMGGDSNDEDVPADIVGTWTLISDVEDVSLTFNSDGTFEATEEGETGAGFYLVSGDSLQLALDDEDEIVTFTFSITGNTMTLEGDHNSGTFERG